jgi:multicomponent Na+:H+ antiporter subunit E
MADTAGFDADRTHVGTSCRQHRRRVRWRASLRTTAGLFVWAFAAWCLITWTATVEQFAVGALAALLVAVALAPLGPVVGPWRLLTPRWLAAALRLVGVATVRIVQANLRLTRLIWSPSRPLRDGMVVVTSTARSDAALTAVGLVTSVIVDSQLVDVDRDGHRMQYHGVEIPPDSGGEANRLAINAEVERLMPKVYGRRAGDAG